MDANKDEYASAFNEGIAIDDGAITEDMAAPGLVPDELEGDMANKEADPAMAQAQQESAEAMAEDEEEAAEDAGPAPATPVPMDKETQRLKSWEGRLKAREAELSAREAAMTKPPAGQATEGAAADAVSQVADAVASGQDVDDALQSIEDDFGPEFAQALMSLVAAQAARIADERMVDVSADVSSLIDTLKSDKAREHFEIISERHPDFMDIAANPEFQDWAKQQGEAAEKIVATGSARQVCALLDAFKQGSAEQRKDPVQSAAVSVPSRSGGLRLPAKPASSEDYMSAWDEA